jgi:hypothetical protein
MCFALQPCTSSLPHSRCSVVDRGTPWLPQHSGPDCTAARCPFWLRFSCDIRRCHSDVALTSSVLSDLNSLFQYMLHNTPVEYRRNIFPYFRVRCPSINTLRLNPSLCDCPGWKSVSNLEWGALGGRTEGCVNHEFKRGEKDIVQESGNLGSTYGRPPDSHFPVIPFGPLIQFPHTV